MLIPTPSTATCPSKTGVRLMMLYFMVTQKKNFCGVVRAGLSMRSYLLLKGAFSQLQAAIIC